MCTSRSNQLLTSAMRLPDKARFAALRMLDASRSMVSQALSMLWSSLDDYRRERPGPAWKQVGTEMSSPDIMGIVLITVLSHIIKGHKQPSLFRE
jgi:hypothetical protein